MQFPRVERNVTLSLALVFSAHCAASSSSETTASTNETASASASGGAASTPPPSSPAPNHTDGDDGDAPAPATDASAPSAAVVAPNGAPRMTRPRDPEEEFPQSDTEPQDVTVTARHPDPTRPDPLHGAFQLERATAGLPPGNDLVAEIETNHGNFTCSLLSAEAPITVANFVGLARGTRDFWDPVAGRWTRRAYYDGSVFHRVIPGFMIQGGDILRMGRGGPGYTIPDENVANHDAAGLLCMANRGPNTGGSQFFITEVPLPRLNGSYSVFGRCTPVDLVQRIARLPRSRRDVPLTPVYIQHVNIHR